MDWQNIGLKDRSTTTTISSHSVRGDPHQMMIKMPNRELEHYKPTSANYIVDLRDIISLLLANARHWNQQHFSKVGSYLFISDDGFRVLLRGEMLHDFWMSVHSSLSKSIRLGIRYITDVTWGLLLLYHTQCHAFTILLSIVYFWNHTWISALVYNIHTPNSISFLELTT